MCCPFHEEKTPSFKIYQGDQRFHCFGCGIDGDIVDFVVALYNITYTQALSKIDNDFNLNYNKRLTYSEKFQKDKARKEDAERKEREKEEKRIDDAIYDIIFEEWIRLHCNKINYAPKNMDDEWHPLFVEACHKLTRQEYILESLS
jgi:DNA primase